MNFLIHAISPFLGITDNHFGFKAGHSTDQCTLLLKQTASYFVTHGSSVHAVLLDASKAFDRVLHMKLFEKLIQRKVPMCFVRLLKHWYKEQTMQIKWGKHFSEPFHVSNRVRQGGVLSPYLFAVYLDDLSNELNNIKAGCYIGEVLLNHLMFADDICVFCPSARWLQRILDVCQAYAESHGIILNCNKTVCMTFEAKSAKSTATPVLKLGGQYGNSVDQYKCLGILLDIELSDDKDYQRQLRYQYYAANKLRASFSRSNAVKNVLFRSFCTPMYAFQLWCNFRKCMQLWCNFRKCMQISACRDCGWHIILVAELYTTCPGERVLVATKFIVTFLPLRLCYVNTSTCFSKDAENLTTYGYVL